MTTMTEKLFELENQRQYLVAAMNKAGITVSANAALLDCLFALAYWAGSAVSIYPYGGVTALLSDVYYQLVYLTRQSFGVNLGTRPALRKVADAIWPYGQSIAYAVRYYDSGLDCYALAFNRALTEQQVPGVGDTYNGYSVEDVWTGFESANAYSSAAAVPWYSVRSTIGAVRFDGGVRPRSTAYWFAYFTACHTFDLGLLDTRLCVSLRYMFYSCQVVTELDVSGFVMKRADNVAYMFGYCYALTTIKAAAYADWSEVGYGSATFSYCTNLVGGNGTAYSASSATAAMARIDGLEGSPGYFTAA